MSVRLALVVVLALAGCSSALTSGTYATTVTYLARQPADAVLDSVAGWARDTPAYAVATDAPGRLVLRDTESEEPHTATVDVRTREDGLTEMAVRWEGARGDRTRSDALPIARRFLKQGDDLLLMPADGSEPACRSVREWRANPEQPLDWLEPDDDGAPELVDGPAGLNQRVRYPVDLRRRGVQGTVLVAFEVSEDGVAECADVVASPHPGLSAAALAAVTPSRFRPATQGGRPIRVRMMVPISFRLN